MGVTAFVCIFIGNLMFMVSVFWDIYVFGKKTKDLYSLNDILYSTDSTQKWDILSVGKNRNIYIVQKPIYICGEQ